MTTRKGKEDPLSVALRLLSFRAQSVHELEARLREKGCEPADIASVVEYLEEAGYLDDRRFATELVETRVRNKAWGRHKIAADLRKRGVPSEVADGALKGLDGPAELKTARAALEKWLRKSGLAPPLEGKAMERAARHLKARGFSSSTIFEALDRPGPSEDD